MFSNSANKTIKSIYNFSQKWFSKKGGVIFLENIHPWIKIYLSKGGMYGVPFLNQQNLEYLKIFYCRFFTQKSRE